MEEKLGGTNGKKICWSGDSNNVLNSLMEGTTIFGYELAIAVPGDHKPCQERIDRARKSGAKITISNDPLEAAADSDCVMTDTWTSMGFEDAAAGHNTFRPFQVNESVMKAAKDDAIFMHCLPAHRGSDKCQQTPPGVRMTARLGTPAPKRSKENGSRGA